MHLQRDLFVKYTNVKAVLKLDYSLEHTNYMSMYQNKEIGTQNRQVFGREI